MGNTRHYGAIAHISSSEGKKGKIWYGIRVSFGDYYDAIVI